MTTTDSVMCDVELGTEHKLDAVKTDDVKTDDVFYATTGSSPSADNPISSKSIDDKPSTTCFTILQKMKREIITYCLVFCFSIVFVVGSVLSGDKTAIMASIFILVGGMLVIGMRFTCSTDAPSLPYSDECCGCTADGCMSLLCNCVTFILYISYTAACAFSMIFILANGKYNTSMAVGSVGVVFTWLTYMCGNACCVRK